MHGYPPITEYCTNVQFPVTVFSLFMPSWRRSTKCGQKPLKEAPIVGVVDQREGRARVIEKRCSKETDTYGLRSTLVTGSLHLQNRLRTSQFSVVELEMNEHLVFSIPQHRSSNLAEKRLVIPGLLQ